MFGEALMWTWWNKFDTKRREHVKKGEKKSGEEE